MKNDDEITNKIDRAISDIDGLIGFVSEKAEDPIERRRYALLQAAATIYADSEADITRYRPGEIPQIEITCVSIAEDMLAEIERREAK